MPTYLAPDVYLTELPSGPRPFEAVGTSLAGFVGEAPSSDERPGIAVACNNWGEFQRVFAKEGARSTPLSHAVYGYFLNGAGRCYVVNVGKGQGIGGLRQGLAALEVIDEIAIVACPGAADPASWGEILDYCERLQDRVAILDPPETVPSVNSLTQVALVSGGRADRAPRGEAAEGGETPSPPAGALGGEAAGGSRGGSSGSSGRAEGGGSRPRNSDRGFGAFYFPRITVVDPLPPFETVEGVAPSGHIAGIWARSDATRGVHKAPANEIVRGAVGLAYRVTREEQMELNPAGVNCIRFFAREGIRVWGARTLDRSASEWRYLNVRRLFNMIEETIVENTRWIVFEPNDYTLWRSIRRDVRDFLTRVWRDGALMGTTPDEAFFVQCDEETNPPEVIDAGMVVTRIGIAPVKPAEFIVFEISQYSGGAEITEGGEQGRA